LEKTLLLKPPGVPETKKEGPSPPEDVSTKGGPPPKKGKKNPWPSPQKGALNSTKVLGSRKRVDEKGRTSPP